MSEKLYTQRVLLLASKYFSFAYLLKCVASTEYYLDRHLIEYLIFTSLVFAYVHYGLNRTDFCVFVSPRIDS